MKPRWLLLPVALLLVWIYTHGFFTNPLKWEEPRRCLVAMEMIESGNYVVPTVLGQPYLKKPPLQNWLVVLLAGNDAARVGPMTVRAVSLLALAGTCLLLWRLGITGKGTPVVLPVLIFLTLATVVQSARAGEIDTPFCFFVSAALAAVEFGRRRGSASIQWFLSQLLVGAGVLTKLIAPLFFYPPVLFWLWRRRRELRFSPGAFALGLAGMAAVVGAWLVPYALQGSTGALGGAWAREVVVRTVGRSAREILLQPLVYPLLLLLWLLPWSLYLLTLRRPSLRDARRLIARDPWLDLAATVAGWGALVFLFVPEQKARYLLPLLPFVAVLLAALLEQARASRPARLLLALGLLYGGVYAGFLEHREAAVGTRHVVAAQTVARAIEGDAPVVIDRRVGLRFCYALSHELGRPLTRKAPAGSPAWWVAPADRTVPPALGPPRVDISGHRLWHVEDPEAWSLLGDPLVAPALSNEVREDFERKLAQAKAELEARPHDVEALIWVGRRTAYLGRHREALAIYTAGIAEHPDEPRLYRHRGHRFITLRRFDAAIEDLEHAARLVAGKPDQVEPDGLPNAQNIPTSTLNSSIWYHLGLAYYLRGDLAQAERCYRECLQFSNNDDMQAATTHWLYMTLRRAGRKREAQEVIQPIHAGMQIIENRGYHELLLMYRGERTPEALLEQTEGDDGTDRATLAYGVGNWYLYGGDRERAIEIFERAQDNVPWAAFGCIAAEADLERMMNRAL